MTSWFDRGLRALVLRLGVLMEEMRPAIAQATLPRFGNTPRNLRIDLPRRIVNPERIWLGDNVWLGPGSLLIALTRYPGPATQNPDAPSLAPQRFESKIVVGQRVTATGNLQIAAHSEVRIDDDVLFATNVNLTDGLHGYHTAEEPYKYQPIFKIAPILIQRGCWIGQNVVVLPGVTIGAQTIVGANSVVTESLPAQCIAVGNPARVIRRWNPATHQWLAAAPVPVPQPET